MPDRASGGATEGWRSRGAMVGIRSGRNNVFLRLGQVNFGWVGCLLFVSGTYGGLDPVGTAGGREAINLEWSILMEKGKIEKQILTFLNS